MPNKQDEKSAEGKAEGMPLGFLLVLSVLGTIVDLGIISLFVIAGARVFGEGIVVVGAVVGIAQLAYKIPFYIGAKVKGFENFQRVIIFSSILTFMLNAGCWGLVVSGEFKVH